MSNWLRWSAEEVCHCAQCDAIDDEMMDCPACGASGCAEDNEGREVECKDCRGTGQVVTR